MFSFIAALVAVSNTAFAGAKDRPAGTVPVSPEWGMLWEGPAGTFDDSGNRCDSGNVPVVIGTPDSSGWWSSGAQLELDKKRADLALPSNSDGKWYMAGVTALSNLARVWCVEAEEAARLASHSMGGLTVSSIQIDAMTPVAPPHASTAAPPATETSSSDRAAWRFRFGGGAGPWLHEGAAVGDHVAYSLASGGVDIVRPFGKEASETEGLRWRLQAEAIVTTGGDLGWYAGAGVARVIPLAGKVGLELGFTAGPRYLGLGALEGGLGLNARGYGIGVNPFLGVRPGLGDGLVIHLSAPMLLGVMENEGEDPFGWVDIAPSVGVMIALPK